MKCSKCQSELGSGFEFCEDCGAPVPAVDSDSIAIETPSPPDASDSKDSAPVLGPCEDCGETGVSNGVCNNCGKQRIPADAKVVAKPRVLTPRDHIEQVIAPDFAAVSDIGPTHASNQDCVQIVRTTIHGVPVEVIGVFDGVSMSETSQVASEAAAKIVAETTVAALEEGRSEKEAILAALCAAQLVVAGLPYKPDPSLQPAATTAVVAVLTGKMVTVGWAGDSRAYLVFKDTVMQLTRDHSWANDAKDAGWTDEEIASELTRKPKYEHAVVRTLGRLEEGETFQPEVTTAVMDGALYLLATTDGFWNHVDDPKEVRKLIKSAGAGSDALRLAKFLVNDSNARDGHDNVTVAVRAFAGAN